ncbi:MAG: ATP-binding protein [bacterium]
MTILKRQHNPGISWTLPEEDNKGQDNSKIVNRFGLLIIGVAAITVSLILFLFYRYEKRTGEKQLARDGFTLCSLIADLVRQEVLVDNQPRDLNLLDYVVREKGIVYCLAINNDGVPLVRLGRQAPEEGFKPTGDSEKIEHLLTQKRLESQNGEVIYEFSKPIYLEGKRAGLVKIGLALSDYVYLTQETNYLAGGIALSIFGLVFLFYYLLKRLFSPLYQMNYHLRQIIKEEQEFPKIEVSFHGEVGQLARRMNQLLLTQKKKSQKQEEINAELEISNKVLLYEKIRMRAILDNLKAGIIVIDSTGRCIMANKLAGHFLKGELQDYLGKPWKDFLQDHEPDLVQLFTKFYDKGNIYGHDSLEIQKTEGDNPAIFHHTFSYLLNAEDKPLGFLWMITDITSQKQSELSKYEFVNHVAHELKTPLNTLVSYSEMLLDGEVNDEQTKREFFNNINEEAIRLSRLINNLLNISKIEMGCLKINRTLIKVDKLLRDCFQTVRAQALSKGINFTVDMADKMPNLLLDKDLIEVAILNLLTNAIKYTPAMGEVTLQGIVEEESVLIRVTDSGYGIPEDEINHIFDKFFRSSKEEVKKEPGTGLGLSLAMNIVQLHKGDIRVESKWGSGSSFTIILPKEEVYI